MEPLERQLELLLLEMMQWQGSVVPEVLQWKVLVVASLAEFWEHKVHFSESLAHEVHQ